MKRRIINKKYQIGGGKKCMFVFKMYEGNVGYIKGKNPNRRSMEVSLRSRQSFSVLYSSSKVSVNNWLINN